MTAAAEVSRRACRIRVTGWRDEYHTGLGLPGHDVAERPVPGPVGLDASMPPRTGWLDVREL